MKNKPLNVCQSFKLLSTALLIAISCFNSKAQNAADSLTTVMNVDSGVVNIDTAVVIHKSLLTIEGGNQKTGQLEIGVAKDLGDLMPGAKEGDVVIAARGGGSSQTTATNMWDCQGPKIITHANNIQFWLDPCFVPQGCPYNVFDVLNLDKNGVTINTQFIDQSCAWLGSTTINGPTYQNGNFKITGATTQNGSIVVNGFETVNGNLTVTNTNAYEIFKVNATDSKVYAREINVQTAAFPDYVFEPNYTLMSLEALDDYVKANHHLPEIPTATEMETNGMDLSALNTVLTKKVEELSLYMIELNKKIKNLEAEVDTLRK